MGRARCPPSLGAGLPRSPAAAAWRLHAGASQRAVPADAVKDIYFQSCVFDLLTTAMPTSRPPRTEALEGRGGTFYTQEEAAGIFSRGSARAAPRGRPLSSVSLGLTCLILVVFL